jgi:hypothetical protein
MNDQTPKSRPPYAGLIESRGRGATANNFSVQLLDILLNATEAERLNILSTAREYADHPSLRGPGQSRRLELMLRFAIDELTPTPDPG